MFKKIYWKALLDGLPDKDQYPRVLVYRQGFDDRSEQVFDVKSDQLSVFPTGPDGIDNPAFCATHWAALPIP